MDEENNPIKDEEHHEEKQETHETSRESSPSSKSNIWKPIAIIMTVLFIIAAGSYIFMPPTGMVTGGVLVESEASAVVIDYVSNNLVSPDVAVNVTEIARQGNFYKITIALTADDFTQEVESYMSLDGQYFFPSGYDVTEEIEIPEVTTSVPAEITKSDTPKVELFIWAYCPYGVQAQGPLAEVASLLEDSADFESVLYYDGHGDYETQQNKIQACIQELEPEKYWDYAATFVEDIYPNCGASGDIDCDKTESVKLMDSLGIDSDAVMDCVDSQGETLITTHSQRASDYGVTGSPTLVINGVIANVARTAEAYKQAVCSAFNDAPAECDEVLSGDVGTTDGSC